MKTQTVIKILSRRQKHLQDNLNNQFGSPASMSYTKLELHALAYALELVKRESDKSNG